MKKYLISLLASFAFCAGGSAQTLSVAGDVEALASGETVSVNLHIAEAESMTSIHFELSLPEWCSLSVKATPAWDAMYTANAGNVSAISTTSNAFSGEGDIATLQFTVSAGTAIGAYPVTINNMRVNGEDLGTTVTFNVKVVNAHTVILDENSETAPEDAAGVNVQVKRTINANEWSTICLPFDMTEEQIAEAFPETVVQLGDFTGCEATEDADENIVELNIKFQNATAIEANHPYIIKVNKKVEEFAVNDVDIEVEDEPSVDCDPYIISKKVTLYNRFVGTYSANTEVPELVLFISGNKFWYSTGNTMMKAFRAYFDFYDVLTEVEDGYASRISLSFEEEGGTTTGISENERMRNGENMNVYDLQGRKVNSQFSIHNSQLRSGIYVKNGKKVVIK